MFGIIRRYIMFNTSAAATFSLQSVSRNGQAILYPYKIYIMNNATQVYSAFWPNPQPINYGIDLLKLLRRRLLSPLGGYNGKTSMDARQLICSLFRLRNTSCILSLCISETVISSVLSNETIFVFHRISCKIV